jgi:GDP-L-fucose synthase
VIVAAGRVGGIVENQTYPADFITANLSISLNVICSAHRAEVKRLIYFGSSCIYPRECPQPMSEESILTGKPEPTSLAYATAKLAGVQLCLSLNQQYGKKRYVPVIPNSAFGPNDNFDPSSGHVLAALIRRFHEAKLNNADSVVLWGTGTPRREFVFSDDIADACIHLLSRDVTGLDLPVNLGIGQDVSIKELAEMIAKLVEYHGRIDWDSSKPDGAPQKLLDSRRLNQFGWRPKENFLDRLRTTYAWYLASLANPT